MNPISKFFANAEINPSAVAFASPNLEILNSNLSKSVQYFAASFRKSGIQKGTIVAVSAKPEIECVAILALLQLGAVSLSGTESVLRGHHRKIDYLITDNSNATFSGKNLISINPQFLSELGLTKPLEEIEQLDPNDLVRLVFSSGTTGTPKGVPFTVQNLLDRIESANANWMPLKPFMSLLGLDTVTGIQTFYRNMFAGETYLVPTMGQGNASLISKFKVQSIKTSPARLKDLLVALPENTEHLKIVQVAGSVLSNALVEQCEKQLAITPLYLYGSTEVGTVTKGVFRKDSPSNVGVPVSDVDFEIIDGVIRYRKKGMPGDYWQFENQTQSSFRDGWFYPGDLGSLNERGELVLSGRGDDVVNVGGAKFNLLELDIWLQSLGLFKDVASFQTKNQFDEIELGIAFVVDAPPIPEMLVAKLRAFNPDLTFEYLIHLEKIPRNVLDKVDRQALVASLKR